MLRLSDGAVLAWDHEVVFGTLPAQVEDLVYLESSIEGVLARVQGESSPESDIVELGESGTLVELAKFLERNHVDHADDRGFTVAMMAARGGNIEVLRACVERGASTAFLMAMAAQSDSREVVEFLLEQGVDINQTSRKGKPPLNFVTNDDFHAYMVSKGASE